MIFERKGTNLSGKLKLNSIGQKAIFSLSGNIPKNKRYSWQAIHRNRNIGNVINVNAVRLTASGCFKDTSVSSSKSSSSSVSSNRSSASSSATGYIPNITPDMDFQLKLWVIRYDPVEDGQSLSEKYISYLFGGKTAKEYIDLLTNQQIEAFKTATNGLVNFNYSKYTHLDSFPTYPH